MSVLTLAPNLTTQEEPAVPALPAASSGPNVVYYASSGSVSTFVLSSAGVSDLRSEAVASRVARLRARSAARSRRMPSSDDPPGHARHLAEITTALHQLQMQTRAVRDEA